ncbi:Putative Zn-dependent protease, contains TPR repeats [Sphingomonas laterariae]|uniref:Putative Zn-dependent protease, contains TPR repeats n=1 Tax=Edaphosphingomonas laterariae TaxID=861865 RepID=A0A239HQ40_9SPHN|nr:M48 family metallopeptidase [Sphingomonas laterariae]SNS83400.1 Putative Zn-dependent protease, contains TPR repeats [Sphingomonas laterariae]
MRGTLAARAAIAAVAALLPAAIAGAEVRAPAPLPPYAQAYEPTTVDERGLWMEVDEVERKLRDSRFVIKDQKLVDYVQGVLCRTVGDDRCRAVRIYVVRDTAFNASMAPNGMMVVHSGLLLRVKDEAELGSVLGHEFGHFELRHSLNGFKQRRTASDVMTWLAILAPNTGGALATGIAGSAFAFSRGQEQDADMLGLSYLAASPYPSASAANVWERLMAEQDATAAGRKRKAQHRYSAGFFASHPTELTRATYLREAAARAPDPGDAAQAAYRATMAAFLPDFLDDQIKLNDFGGTEYLLNQLAGDQWTPQLLYARGELYRQRGNPRDLVSAAQFYQEAIAKGYAGAEAQRGLGLSLMRSQQVEQGRAALQEYLKLKPDAADASLISTLVAN